MHTFPSGSSLCSYWKKKDTVIKSKFTACFHNTGRLDLLWKKGLIPMTGTPKKLRCLHKSQQKRKKRFHVDDHMVVGWCTEPGKAKQWLLLSAAGLLIIFHVIIQIQPEFTLRTLNPTLEGSGVGSLKTRLEQPCLQFWYIPEKWQHLA